MADFRPIQFRYAPLLLFGQLDINKQQRTVKPKQKETIIQKRAIGLFLLFETGLDVDSAETHVDAIGATPYYL